MAETIPNNSENSETIQDNPAESLAPEPAEPTEPAAKKRGRPKGASDKAPRAPKKKAVVLEEPIQPEKPPEPEPPPKPQRTRVVKPKPEPAQPVEAREPDPQSPRTTIRAASYHILQLQSLRDATRRSHLVNAYTKNLR